MLRSRIRRKISSLRGGGVKRKCTSMLALNLAATNEDSVVRQFRASLIGPGRQP
jgi:hypothetical protein